MAKELIPDDLALAIRDNLRDRQLRLVLAESCTAGSIAATLGRIPGISNHLCGSAVVYREGTKREWLGVDENLLKTHTAVSAEVTAEITCSVLRRTSEAHVALGITGHLGPGAPERQDGLVFIAVWQRGDAGLPVELMSVSERLSAKGRGQRQAEATLYALQQLEICLQDDA